MNEKIYDMQIPYYIANKVAIVLQPQATNRMICEYRFLFPELESLRLVQPKTP